MRASNKTSTVILFMMNTSHSFSFYRFLLVILPASREHLLQLDHDSYHGLLVSGLVEIDAVAVMHRDQLLPDGRDRLIILIEEHEIQAKDIALDLPVQALDIGDVLDDVEQFVGERELLPVRHGDKMLFMQTDRFFLQVRHLCAGRVKNVRFAFQRENLGLCPIQRLPLLVLDFDLLVQVSGIKDRVDRAGRYPVFLCVDLIRTLARGVKALDPG